VSPDTSRHRQEEREGFLRKTTPDHKALSKGSKKKKARAARGILVGNMHAWLQPVRERQTGEGLPTGREKAEGAP